MNGEELRCGACNYWLGESVAPLVRLGTVEKSSEATVKRPRDLRVCKSCGKVNVFLARSALGLDAPAA
jgi:hypothetical protein